MKILIDKTTKKYRYYCDRCNKEISFKDNTLKQLYVKEGKKTHKLCDLCNKCYRSLEKGVYK